ncbi:hypothetical protein PILCRDRAFT_17166 [Piloderma croceum F 1598]|uniref:Uncharacterized protein n=1 Tax=Piloderma croceum (strain F 1598) TaxID=765440 RepID=A0A0C3EU33_PILCF|nr:hypothetical protein PILCRDRAFT_17166 [Piloderma croceum F 1598]
MSNPALTKGSTTRSSNPTRNHSSNPTTQQSQITLDDVNTGIAAAASSELARQAPLLPPINIASQGYSLPTSSVIHPPPKKRKPVAAPDPVSTTSKPPRNSKKRKQKATTPSPQPVQSPSSRKSSPIPATMYRHIPMAKFTAE